MRVPPWVSTLRLFLLGVTIQRSEQLLLGRLTVYDGPSGWFREAHVFQEYPAHLADDFQTVLAQVAGGDQLL